MLCESRVSDLDERVQRVPGRRRVGLQDATDGVALVQGDLQQVPLQLQLLQPGPGGRGELHHLARQGGQQGQQGGDTWGGSGENR